MYREIRSWDLTHIPMTILMASSTTFPALIKVTKTSPLKASTQSSASAIQHTYPPHCSGKLKFTPNKVTRYTFPDASWWFSLRHIQIHIFIHPSQSLSQGLPSRMHFHPYLWRLSSVNVLGSTFLKGVKRKCIILFLFSETSESNVSIDAFSPVGKLKPQWTKTNKGEKLSSSVEFTLRSLALTVIPE